MPPTRDPWQQPEKPKRAKVPRPVESFGPELLAALLKAATTPVVLHMPWNMAIRFRLRVHQMRESMRKAGHPKYEICSKVRIGIELPPNCPTHKSGRHHNPDDTSVGVRVLLSPNDSEFGPLLAEAGIRPLGEVEATTRPATEGQPPMTALEAMFGEIKTEKS